MALNYIRLEPLSLRQNPELNELWVQDRIAEEPSLLGLGDIVLKDKQRSQPRAGRLDLLFQDAEANKRYEVELQLGKTDESHIMRTIEYWDIEKKRYPQYEHTAVIVAEEITSRFLNVIGLFNGFIPLVAIQMKAYQLGDSVALTFATVRDEMPLGLVDEDEEIQEPADRAYWEKRGSKLTLSMADEILAMVHEWDADLALKYNKFYIGLAKGGQPSNFVIFRPKKEWLRLEVALDRSEEIQQQLEQEGLDLMEYDSRWGKYRIRLTKPDIKKHESFLRSFLRQAYDEFAPS